MQNATACSGGVVNRSRFAATRVLATLLVTVLMLGSAAGAATINYGDFGPIPPGVTFTQVRESSGTDNTPLFGPPTPFVTGLDFDPASFVAFGSGGTSDVTDGQLNFGLNAPGGINSFNLFEAGDYTLAGVGTPATSVFAGAIIRVTVTEVNGVAVAPFELTPVTSSFSDALPPTAIVQPWSMGLGFDVDGQLGVNQNATKIEVSINNQLLALSEAGSAAFIAKKEFRIDVNAVPEPGTLSLAAIGLLALAHRRRASMN